MQEEWIEHLISFFKANEPFFSGLGNFIAILSAIVGVAGFVFGWWRRLYRWVQTTLQRRAERRATAFPFELVSNPEQLIEKLMPDPEQRVILDREIQYIPGRIEGLDALFESHGRILIKGRTKAGKTREMAELISRHWHAGLAVLLLRRHAWLEAPFFIPEGLPYRNVVLIIDDVDHYCAFDGPLTGDEALPSSTQYESFPLRLQQAIEYFESICGSPDEVRVVATVRQEPEFWNKIQFDRELPPWSSFELFRLDDLPAPVATRLIDQLSKMTNIRVTNDAKAEMATKNDGTFLNIILQFRDWRRKGETSIGASHIETFEGKLTNTWQKRYERAVAANPANRYIYAAIDILRRMNLVPHRYLVTELATRLGGSVTARISRTFQTQARQLFERSRQTVRRSETAKRLVDRHLTPGRWYNQLEGSRLATVIDRYLLYQIGDLKAKGGSASIRKALQELVEAEIPIQNDILVPYDGQVDGRGDEWINSDVISPLLTGQASQDEHFVYGLISLADKLYDDHDYQAALRMLDRAIQIAPQHSFARRKRAKVYHILKQYDAALSDIDVWIQLDPSDDVAYAHEALVLRGLDMYDEAIESIDKAISMSPAQGWLYFGKAEILVDQRRLDEALAAFDKAIELDPDLVWAIARRGMTYQQMARYAEALADFNRAIALDPDDDRCLYNRALTYQVLSQVDRAQADLTAAIRQARQRYDRDSQDWTNTFNLALYHLAAGEPEEAQHRYQEALSAGTPLPRVSEASHDLEDFLALFPDHEPAQAMRNLLLEHLEETQK